MNDWFASILREGATEDLAKSSTARGATARCDWPSCWSVQLAQHDPNSVFVSHWGTLLKVELPMGKEEEGQG